MAGAQSTPRAYVIRSRVAEEQGADRFAKNAFDVQGCVPSAYRRDLQIDAQATSFRATEIGTCSIRRSIRSPRRCHRSNFMLTRAQLKTQGPETVKSLPRCRGGKRTMHALEARSRGSGPKGTIDPNARVDRRGEVISEEARINDKSKPR